MQQADETVQPRVATLHVEGKKIIVSVLVSYDGVEYVGRLWFNEADTYDEGVPDRGPLSGRSKGEVETLAKKLTEAELLARYRRALTNKRRYLALRATTNELLRNVRYLNQVAISMRAGLLDAEGAAAEIELTERQLHDIVEKLKVFAGIEG